MYLGYIYGFLWSGLGLLTLITVCATMLTLLCVRGFVRNARVTEGDERPLLSVWVVPAICFFLVAGIAFVLLLIKLFAPGAMPF